MREDDGGDSEEPEELGEKRRQLDETEISSDIHHPKASDYSHNKAMRITRIHDLRGGGGFPRLIIL
jgi:hypothetical protein